MGGYTNLINVENNNLMKLAKQNPITIYGLTIL